MHNPHRSLSPSPRPTRLISLGTAGTLDKLLAQEFKSEDDLEEEAKMVRPLSCALFVREPVQPLTVVSLRSLGSSTDGVCGRGGSEEAED